MTDEHGVISAYTCANLIILPRGYLLIPLTHAIFKMAMLAALTAAANAFNTFLTDQRI